MTTSNHRFIRAIFKEPVDCTPIWIMRQAGRYLPEYRSVRKQVPNFMNLVKNPDLACEVTLQPLRRFPLDAAIIFSDILTIPDAMGLGLSFQPGLGPIIERPVRSSAAVKALPELNDGTEFNYLTDAIAKVNNELAGTKPLIGFAGSPWTLAAYIVEGGSSKQFDKLRALRYTDSKLLHELLAKLSMAVITYVNAQINAGVDAIMLFDTWGGLLAADDYPEFSLRYLQMIFEGMHIPAGKRIPKILFTKQGGQWLESMVTTGCDMIGIDWTTSMAVAKAQVGAKVALQGNLDPAVLYGTPEEIKRQAHRVLTEFGPGSGHVFNLGHGILPDMEPERVACLVDAVHSFKHDV